LGQTLLQDFNEIDRYLLDSSYVLSYLKDIEDIVGIEVENKTQLKNIDFWKLPNYYQTLYAHLLKKRNWLSRINLPGSGI
jgi:hypothetical protein